MLHFCMMNIYSKQEGYVMPNMDGTGPFYENNKIGWVCRRRVNNKNSRFFQNDCLSKKEKIMLLRKEIDEIEKEIKTLNES